MLFMAFNRVIEVGIIILIVGHIAIDGLYRRVTLFVANGAHDRAADDDAEHRVKNQVVDLVLADRGVGPFAARAREPPAEHKAEHVHQSVPANFEKPDRENDRVDLRIGQHQIALGVE